MVVVALLLFGRLAHPVGLGLVALLGVHDVAPEVLPAVELGSALLAGVEVALLHRFHGVGRRALGAVARVAALLVLVVVHHVVVNLDNIRFYCAQLQ